MNSEQNLRTVRRFFDEVCNDRNLAVADELFAADYKYFEPPSVSASGVGPAAIKREVSGYHEALPDARWIVHDLIPAADDHVVVRWTGVGTHHGHLGGLPPTGRSVQVPALMLFRLRDGRIVESWNLWDTLGMMQQLGLAPALEATATDPAAVARAIYGRFSDGDLDGVFEYVAEDVEAVLVPFGQTFRGKEGFMGFMRGFKDAFPDIRITVHNQIVSGDHVTNEFTARGTHGGVLQTPAGPVAPTGRTVDFTVCEVLTVRDGRLTRLCNYQDAASLMRQIS